MHREINHPSGTSAHGRRYLRRWAEVPPRWHGLGMAQHGTGRHGTAWARHGTTWHGHGMALPWHGAEWHGAAQHTRSLQLPPLIGCPICPMIGWSGWGGGLATTTRPSFHRAADGRRCCSLCTVRFRLSLLRVGLLLRGVHNNTPNGFANNSENTNTRESPSTQIKPINIAACV